MKGTGLKLFYILIGIIAVVLYLSGSTLKHIFNMKNEVASYEEKLNTLKEWNGNTENELKWMETEEDYMKFIARKDLGFVEEDEMKFFIVESSNIPKNRE
ncbi:MAG: septum formation initiator family protein [Elusimicrobiota bacterium]